ncbi:MAG: hypothetical protein ABIO85_02455 [Sphingomicrobium sp.]
MNTGRLLDDHHMGEPAIVKDEDQFEPEAVVLDPFPTGCKFRITEAAPISKILKNSKV